MYSLFNVAILPLTKKKGLQAFCDCKNDPVHNPGDLSRKGGWNSEMVKGEQKNSCEVRTHAPAPASVYGTRGNAVSSVSFTH